MNPFFNLDTVVFSTQGNYPTVLNNEPNSENQIANIDSLRNLLIDKGFIDEAYHLQVDRLILPEPSVALIAKNEFYQTFMNVNIDYVFEVTEEKYEVVKLKLFRGLKEGDLEAIKVQKFLDSIRGVTFAKSCSFLEVLTVFFNLHKENPSKIEMIGGWVSFILTNQPHLLNQLVKFLLETNGITLSFDLIPNKTRQRPEMDIKFFYAGLTREELLKKSDLFLNSFLHLFDLDHSHDRFYYRELFKLFLPKISSEYPESFLGVDEHKLNVLFVGEPSLPLFATDQVTLRLVDSIKADLLNPKIIKKTNLEHLYLSFTNLQELYQCLFNYLFQVDQVIDPESVNDKGLIRCIAKLNFGIFVDPDQISAVLHNGKLKRRLGQLYLDFHKNHHEGDTDLLMGLILNGFLILEKADSLKMAQFLWEDLKPHFVSTSLSRLSQKFYDILNKEFTPEAYTKDQFASALQSLKTCLHLLAYFEKDCQVTVRDYQEEAFVKMQFDSFSVWLPKYSSNQLLNLLINLPEPAGLQPFFSEEWLNQPSPLLQVPQASHLEFIEKLKIYCDQSFHDPFKCKIVKKICETIPFPPINLFAKKLLKPAKLKSSFIEQFIHCEEPISSLASESFFELDRELRTGAFKVVLSGLFLKSCQKAISFVKKCLAHQSIDVEEIHLLYKKFDLSQYESVKECFDFTKFVCEEYAHLISHTFFDHQIKLFSKMIEKDVKQGVEFIYLLREKKLMSSQMDEELIKQVGAATLRNKFFFQNLDKISLDNLFKEKVVMSEIYGFFKAHPDQFIFFCQNINHTLLFFKHLDKNDQTLLLLKAFLLNLPSEFAEQDALSLFNLLKSFLSQNQTIKTSDKFLDSFKALQKNFFQNQFPLAFEIILSSVQSNWISTKNARVILKGCWENLLNRVLSVEELPLALDYAEKAVELQIIPSFPCLFVKLHEASKALSQPSEYHDRLLNLTIKVPKFISLELDELLEKKYKQVQEDELKLIDFYDKFCALLPSDLYRQVLSKLCHLGDNSKSHEYLPMMIVKLRVADIDSAAMQFLNNFIKKSWKRLPEELKVKTIFNPRYLEICQFEEEDLTRIFEVLKNQKEVLSYFYGLIKKGFTKSDEIVNRLQNKLFDFLNHPNTLNAKEREELLQTFLHQLMSKAKSQSVVLFLEKILYLSDDLRILEKDLLLFFKKEIKHDGISLQAILDRFGLLKKLGDKFDDLEKHLSTYQIYMEWMLRQNSEGYERQLLDAILCYISLCPSLSQEPFVALREPFVTLFRNFYFRCKNKPEYHGLLKQVIADLKNLLIYQGHLSKDDKQFNDLLKFIMIESDDSLFDQMDLFQSHLFYNTKCLRTLIEKLGWKKSTLENLDPYFKLFEFHLNYQIELKNEELADHITILSFLSMQDGWNQKWLVLLYQGIKRLGSNLSKALRHPLFNLQCMIAKIVNEMDEKTIINILSEITVLDLRINALHPLWVAVLLKAVELLKNNNNPILLSKILNKIDTILDNIIPEVLFKIYNGKKSIVERVLFTVVFNKLPLNESYQKKVIKKMITFYLHADQPDVENGLIVIRTLFNLSEIKENFVNILDYACKGECTPKTELGLTLIFTSLLKTRAYAEVAKAITRQNFSQIFPELSVNIAWKLYSETKETIDLGHYLNKFSNNYFRFIYKRSGTDSLQNYVKQFKMMEGDVNSFFSSLMNILLSGLLENHVRKVSKNVAKQVNEMYIPSKNELSKIFTDEIFEKILANQPLPFEVETIEVDQTDKIAMYNCHFYIQLNLWKYFLSKTIHSDECHFLLSRTTLKHEEYEKIFDSLCNKITEMLDVIKNLTNENFDKFLGFLIFRLSKVELDELPHTTHHYFLFLEVMLNYLLKKGVHSLGEGLLNCVYEKLTSTSYSFLYKDDHLSFYQVFKSNSQDQLKEELDEDKLIKLFP